MSQYGLQDCCNCHHLPVIREKVSIFKEMTQSCTHHFCSHSVSPWHMELQEKLGNVVSTNVIHLLGKHSEGSIIKGIKKIKDTGVPLAVSVIPPPLIWDSAQIYLHQKTSLFTLLKISSYCHSFSLYCTFYSFLAKVLSVDTF